MSLLDKLWDETLTGTHPDFGLGRLRKPSALHSFGQDGAALAGEERSNTAADGCVEEASEMPRVTRSIMIKRSSGWASPGIGTTPPSSPTGSTPPVSPFAGAVVKEWNRFSRRLMSDAYGKGGETVGGDSSEASISSYPPFEV